MIKHTKQFFLVKINTRRYIAWFGWLLYIVSRFTRGHKIQCYFYINCNGNIQCSTNLPKTKIIYSKYQSGGDNYCRITSTIDGSHDIDFNCQNFRSVTEYFLIHRCNEQNISISTTTDLSPAYPSASWVTEVCNQDNSLSIQANIFIYNLCTRCLVLRHEIYPKYISELVK